MKKWGKREKASSVCDNGDYGPSPYSTRVILPKSLLQENSSAAVFCLLKHFPVEKFSTDFRYRRVSPPNCSQELPQIFRYHSLLCHRQPPEDLSWTKGSFSVESLVGVQCGNLDFQYFPILSRSNSFNFPVLIRSNFKGPILRRITRSTRSISFLKVRSEWVDKKTCRTSFAFLNSTRCQAI